MPRVAAPAAAFGVTWLLLAATASAQQQPPAPSTPPPPRWDLVAGAGYIFTPEAESGSPYLGYSRLEFQVNVARYASTRLRTEVGFSTTTRDDGYDWGEAPGFGLVAVDRLVRLHTVVAAVSYSFFEENVFVHPYLSGGVRLGALSERRRSYPTYEAWILDRPVNADRTSFVFLPYAAAGVTNRINDRAFTRSELVVAFGSRGFEHATLRVGVGVYFGTQGAGGRP